MCTPVNSGAANEVGIGERRVDQAPSAHSAAADAAQKPAITPTDFSIVNQPGASSYPITGYSWAPVYAHQPSQAIGHQLVSRVW